MGAKAPTSYTNLKNDIKMSTKTIQSKNHKVTKRDVMEAIQYFHTEDFIGQLSYDERHYVEILLRKVANVYNMRLEDENGHLI